ncbi:MAG TPA: hypothetical protein VGZ00_08095 [Candidatus Baltobacteraceae bacterium]|jgi:2-phosphoglycerate kinase|nr:hypothetical protein [Candidatus Baltobacteraceae bacterium]
MSGNDFPALRERLRHVRWLGGGSGAGKSTIARQLADKHGLRLYSTDDAMTDHAARCSAEDSPFLTTFKAMTMDERWVDRSPQTMLETFHWFRGEGFGLIVDDLLKLPPNEGILVEGFRLLPSLVEPLLHDLKHAVWLIPTPEFRHAAFESRGTLWSIAEKTSRPERALENLLERDRLFSDQLEEMAHVVGVPVIRVDRSMTERTIEELVAVKYGLRRGV